MYVDFGGICNSRFNAYYIYVRVLLDDFFPNSEIKKEPIHVPIIKKNYLLGTHPIFVFSSLKTLVFSHIIKIEILLNTRALAPFAPIPRAPKILYRATLLNTTKVQISWYRRMTCIGRTKSTSEKDLFKQWNDYYIWRPELLRDR